MLGRRYRHQMRTGKVQGIKPGRMTHSEFQKQSGITDRKAVASVLDELLESGIGCRSKAGRSASVTFSDADRLAAAVLAIQSGCDIERVSTILSWKDFEGLAAQVMSLSGYRTSTNVRFRRPRMEIDVVGVMNGTAVAVDCKHWNRRNLAAIREVSRKQALRCSRLVEPASEASGGGRKITKAFPVILTLYPLSFRFVDEIPIVPVNQFSSFIRDIDLFAGEMRFVC